MAVMSERRSDVAGLARMWGLTRQAVRKRIERAVGKSRAREVRFDGIRLIRKGPRCWIVYIGARWLAEGRCQQWAPLEVFAKQRGLCPRELRRQLPDSATETSDGVEFTCEGHRVLKLGVRWMVCLGVVLP